LKVTKNGSAKRTSSNGIAMDINVAFDRLQFFCKKFGWCGKDKTDAIFDLFCESKGGYPEIPRKIHSSSRKIRAMIAIWPKESCPAASS
jgi:hypothetical protein